MADAQPLEARIASAKQDANGHGTHVAGIIAGGLLGPNDLPGNVPFVVAQSIAASGGGVQIRARTLADPSRLAGVAPRCKLVSLRIQDANAENLSSNVIRALQYVREELNGNGKLLRVHGINLSLGYEFNARWFACGQSPICVEVNRLVRSGVVVVVAAGNTGYGLLNAQQRGTSSGMALTINDPGNADLAITVGSTHRDKPHTYGVSYYSSKGPTGDGRLKPDLVAPGERITSCAAGLNLAKMALIRQDAPPNAAAYIDDSGTSMAAPHVSGAIAAFLSIRKSSSASRNASSRFSLMPPRPWEENAISRGMVWWI
jgi:subtilisin family serine protease